MKKVSTRTIVAGLLPDNRQRQKSLARTVFRNLGSPTSLCSSQYGFRVAVFTAEATWQPSRRGLAHQRLSKNADCVALVAETPCRL